MGRILPTQSLVSQEYWQYGPMCRGYAAVDCVRQMGKCASLSPPTPNHASVSPSHYKLECIGLFSYSRQTRHVLKTHPAWTRSRHCSHHGCDSSALNNLELLLCLILCCFPHPAHRFGACIFLAADGVHVRCFQLQPSIVISFFGERNREAGSSMANLRHVPQVPYFHRQCPVLS